MLVRGPIISVRPHYRETQGFAFLYNVNYLPLNMDMIQIMIAITTITEIMPTAAPALKIPLITEQLLKHNSNKMMDGKYNFFINRFF
jgi:hypothetical protein